MKKIKLKCQYFPEKNPCYFEARSGHNKNGYNRGTPLDSIMGRQSPLVDIERDQKFDDDVVKRLAKILEDLQNLED